MDALSPLSPPPAVTVQDVLRVLWRRKGAMLLVLAVSLATSAYVSRRTPKRYRAEAELILVQRAPTISMSSQNNYTGPTTESTETQLALLQSPGMAQKTIDLLKNEALAQHRPTDDIGASADDLRKSLTALVPKDTNLITVTVESDSPAHAQNLANAVCRAFVQWKQDLAQQSFKDAMNSLETRANRAAQQLTRAEAQVEAFKRSHQLVDVPVQQQELLHQYMQRDSEVTQLTGEQTALQARAASAGAHLNQTNAAIRQAPGLRDDAQVLALQQQLSQLEMERSQAALKYTPEYPGVLPDLDAHIADVKTRLAQAVAGTVDNKRPSLQAQGTAQEDMRQAHAALEQNQARLGAATRQRDSLHQQLQGVPQAGLQYARLTRDTELARTLSTSLQGSLNSARLDKDMATGNVEVAQEARLPDQPFRPNPSRDLLIGGGVGLVLALLTAMLLEQADSRVRTLADVQRLVSSPIVGTLPRLSRGESRALNQGRAPMQVAEAYSLAQANLSIAARRHTGNDAHQVLMVTSALPGEGKSVTAAQMARSLARAGKRVILVDADLRRPTQNLLFNIDEPHGLADVLQGTRALEEVLVASDTDNLLLVPSGRATRPATELISLPRMAQTLDALRAQADVVVVDTPACAIVADALFIAPHADSVLHVIGAGSVDQETVRNTQATLEAIHPDSTAVFINRAPRKRSYGGGYYALGDYAPRKDSSRRRDGSGGSDAMGQRSGADSPLSAQRPGDTQAQTTGAASLPAPISNAPVSNTSRMDVSNMPVSSASALPMAATPAPIAMRVQSEHGAGGRQSDRRAETAAAFAGDPHAPHAAPNDPNGETWPLLDFPLPRPASLPRAAASTQALVDDTAIVTLADDAASIPVNRRGNGNGAGRRVRDGLSAPVAGPAEGNSATDGSAMRSASRSMDTDTEGIR